MRIDRIVEIRSEIGAGTRGASLGVDALKIASLKKDKDFFKTIPTVRVKDDNHLLYEPERTRSAKWIRGLERQFRRSSKAVKKAMGKDQNILVVSGDHGSAGGLIAGIKMAQPNSKLGIIWIDAHADLHTPYTTPSGNLHGMPLATALAEDNQAMQRNSPSQDTIIYWEKLKLMGRTRPKVAPEHLVFLGLRDYEKEEAHLIHTHKIMHYNVSQIREMGLAATCTKALEQVQDCDILYVSFDVDSLDPSVSSGTGTPVPEGFQPEEVIELLTWFTQDPRTRVLEITEINPLLDDANRMAEVAFDILWEIVDD